MALKVDEEGEHPRVTAMATEVQGHSNDAGQVVKGQFSALGMFSMCFIISSTWQAWAGTFVTGTYSGGPVALFWGFLIVFLCTLCSSSSMAEFCSAWPVADGQIEWTSRMAPPKAARFMRVYTGWIVLFGYICVSCSAGFIFVTMVFACAILNNPSYVPERWHYALLFWAIIALALIVNIYGTALLDRLNGTITILGLATWVAMIVIFLVKTKEKNPASFVFTEVVNATGWSSNGLAFLLGMLGSSYSMIGYDCVTHMTEEMLRPAVDAPRAMVGSIIVSGITTLAFIIPMLFCIQHIDTLAATPTGLPLLAFIYDTTGSAAASITLTTLTLVTAPIACCSLIAAAGRIGWSIAREKGLPFSGWIGSIHPTRHIPLNAMILASIIQCLLVLIYIGNTALFNSLLVLAVVSLNLSYGLPIVMYYIHGRKEGIPKAPFSLGRLRLLAHMVSLAYFTIVITFLFFPNFLPVTASNMNYSCAIFALLHFVMLADWFIRGRYEVKEGFRGTELEK
ncbi:amino acid transporter [Meredithblackwellia eburnea MCA 4105]